MTFEQSQPVRIISSILRPLNALGGLGAIAVSVFLLFTKVNVFYSLLNLFFVGTLGILLLAGEFNLDIINNNCKFLVTFLGRGLFNIFVGSWVFGLHPVINTDTAATSGIADIIALAVYIVS